MTFFFKIKIKIIKLSFYLLFFILFLSFSLYANVTRKNLIDYNLDYYEHYQRVVEEEKEVRKENKTVLIDKQRASADSWNKRRDKIKKFLDSMLYTFAYKVKYNDNLNGTKDSQEKDTSTLATLNVNYVPRSSARKKRKTDVFFDYQGRGLSMSTGSEDKINAHAVRFGVVQELTDKYSVDANYTGTNSKIESSSGLNKEYSYNVDQTYRAGFEANWGRFPWSFNYSYNRSRHEKEFKTSDSNLTIFDFTGTFKISPKTDLLYEYIMGEAENPHALENDNTYEKYYIGARGKLAPKITGIAKIGWGTTKYLLTNTEVEERAFSINYRPLSRLMMSFAVSSTSTSEVTDTTDDLSLGLRLRYLPPFNKRLTLTSKVVKSQTETNITKDSSESLSFNLGADYGLNKWIKLGLLYEYAATESNISANENEKNAISLTGTLEF